MCGVLKMSMTTRAALDRTKLDSASLEQLQKEAKKLGLEVLSDRIALIESILNYLEKTGPMDLETEVQGISGGGSKQEEEGAAILTRKTVVGAVPKKKTAEEPFTVENLHRALSSVTSAMVRQQQECLAQQQRMFLQQQQQMG